MSVSIKIRSLTGVPLPLIHEAFTAAFADYPVPSDLPFDAFQELLVTRSFSPEHSLGAFRNGQFLGFLLAGCRVVHGRLSGYDVATGVRADGRKQGIGDQLLETLLAQMPAWKMDRFLLEVLDTNEAALRLYQKHGFRFRRRLRCLQRDFGPPSGPVPEANGKEEGEFLSQIDETQWLGFEPSWQNALASYRQAPDAHHVEIWKDAGRVVGYGIVHRNRGNLLQWGVAPGRTSRPNLADALVSLARQSVPGSLRALNIEDGTQALRDLENSGFVPTVDQWEMVYDLFR